MSFNAFYREKKQKFNLIHKLANRWRTICKTVILFTLASGPPTAAHARPSGMKRHSRREKAFKEGNFPNFFHFLKFLKYTFEVIPGSWGVHRCPWFQNRSINMARADPDKKSQMALKECTIGVGKYTKSADL